MASVIWFFFSTYLSALFAHNKNMWISRELIDDLIYTALAGLVLFFFIKWQNERYVNLINKLFESELTLQQSLKEKDVLLAEVHHRVKNNLAVITGIIDLQLLQGVDGDTNYILKKIIVRIKSIAKVHEKLYQKYPFSEIYFDEFIHELSKTIENIYSINPKNIQTKIEAIPLALSMNKAVPLGLLLSESIVNAYQHAFEGMNNGVIIISLKNPENDRYELRIKDNGVGVEDINLLNNSSTLGLKLIKTLCKQIHADLELNSEDGFATSIYFKRD